MKLVIIDGSLREGRATVRVARWAENIAKQVLKDTEIRTIDLKELDLPIFAEPILPMMNTHRNPEGALKTWLDTLKSADGFVVVTPEYNNSMPGSLKNAIDYIGHEVMHKPFLVVSHGANGGARAGMELKVSLNSNLGAIPIAGSVALNGAIGYHEMISEAGVLKDKSLDHDEKKLRMRLEQLREYAKVLAPLRTAR